MERDIKELLILLLECVEKIPDDNFIFGLCYQINYRLKDVTTEGERNMLNEFINDNMPLLTIDNLTGPWGWPPHLKTPRVEWLKQKIAEL